MLPGIFFHYHSMSRRLYNLYPWFWDETRMSYNSCFCHSDESGVGSIAIPKACHQKIQARINGSLKRYPAMQSWINPCQRSRIAQSSCPATGESDKLLPSACKLSKLTLKRSWSVDSYQVLPVFQERIELCFLLSAKATWEKRFNTISSLSVSISRPMN